MKAPPEVQRYYDPDVRQTLVTKPDDAHDLQFWTHEPGEPFRLMTEKEMEERAAAGAKMMADLGISLIGAAPGKTG